MKSLIALQNKLRCAGDHSSEQRIKIDDSFELTEATILIYSFI